MKRRKQFVSPRVVQVAEVLLEKDLLQGPSTQYQTKVISMGQEYQDYELDSPETEYEVDLY